MKKIIKLFTIPFVLIILNSCSSPKTTGTTKFTVYDDKAINEILKSEIGESLITSGEGKIFQISSIEIVQLPSSIKKFPFEVGDILPFQRDNNQWMYYYKDDPDFGIAIGMKDSTKVRPFKNGMFKEPDGLRVKKMISTTTLKECSTCYKQEIVYNGKVNNNLKFVYREYIENMARPAFFQELQYDQNESNIIGFKGLRIEVLKASNTIIEYKILSSFNNVR